MFGAVGGIAATLSLVFGTFVNPFADHSFVLKAIQSLYKVRQTKIQKMFNDGK